MGSVAMVGLAGDFIGDVEISENLNVTGTKNFKIDHPLDPENKYLLHAAIESSEVLNLYSGNIVTDAKGEAVITLPDWFEAMNRDLRYQLTVIGTFAQAIVADEVHNNRFTIKTSAPNVKVSWQVSGVRSDAEMRKHPFEAEENKPEHERGTYLTPEVFGKPEEHGVEWVRHPELMQQLKQKLEAERMRGHRNHISRPIH
jgi:trimeric autotransporter adhesin